MRAASAASSTREDSTLALGALALALRERVQEQARPALNVEAHDASAQRPHARPPFLARHHDGAVERLGHARGIERIDVQRLRQLVVGARELAQHQHPVLVAAAGDELLGDQVHAVAERRDQHDVGRPVQRHHLARRQRRGRCSGSAPSWACANAPWIRPMISSTSLRYSW